jgi:hypothetical protein
VTRQTLTLPLAALLLAGSVGTDAQPRRLDSGLIVFASSRDGDSEKPCDQENFLCIYQERR